MFVVNEGLVAYVKTEGGPVQLQQGDIVPPEADESDVARLVAAGVLSEKAEPKAPVAGKPKD